MTPVVARAPAKVNLALHVGPHCGDGFHEIAIVYQAVDLYDEVAAELRGDGAVSVETRDPAGHRVPGLDDDDRHLAARAAAALRDALGVRTGVHLRVRKQIPVAGGLAGGSADAAAALVACSRLWELDVDARELAELAVGLGSDVPFALLGGTAVGTGRGERLAPVAAATRTTWLVVSSPRGLSTAAVYAETDRLRGTREPPRPVVDPGLPAALERGDLAATAGLLHNDLQPAAVRFRPELAGLLDTGRAVGSLAALVSGSGPSVLLLVPDDVAAGALFADVQARARELAPDAAVRVVHGPVPGAAVLAENATNL